MLTLTVIRRRNVQALFQDFAEAQLAGGEAPKGMEQSFAEKLKIHPTRWSQIKKDHPISDQMARQIEAHCEKETGWLDVDRPSEVPDEAEVYFLELARQAWRAANAKRKRELLRDMKARVL